MSLTNLEISDFRHLNETWNHHHDQKAKTKEEYKADVFSKKLNEWIKNNQLTKGCKKILKEALAYGWERLLLLYLTSSM